MRLNLKILAICVAFLGAAPTHAQMVEHNDPIFRIEIYPLEQGEVHYSYKQLKASKALKLLPEIADLDGERLLQQEGASIEFSKLAYIVNKPVGFFSSTQILSESWLEILFGEKFTKKSDDVFKSKNDQLKIYFDSDDLSSIQSSRSIHAVSQSKKLDPISLSASSTVIFQTKNWTQIDNYISLTASKSIVVSYKIKLINKDLQQSKKRSDFLEEIKSRLIKAYP
jgi:hypothetical protein